MMTADLPAHLADAEEGSINHELAALPVTGVPFHDCQGLVLFLPRTGLTVVPFRISSAHSVDCAVVDAPEGSLYPVGGFHICVGRDEIERAVVRDLEPVASDRVPSVEPPRVQCQRQDAVGLPCALPEGHSGRCW